ncbi:MAG: hypothetical protein INR68_16740 [Methylobacterium mesophilicum]|nr:hypothetical protein [Methylobacterium mesophilicum]
MRRALPQKEVTAAQAKTQLMTLLYSARPAALATFTVEDLCRMYRVPERVVEYELTIARQKRAGEMA